jgi:hypothetical protein
LISFWSIGVFPEGMKGEGFGYPYTNKKWSGFYPAIYLQLLLNSRKILVNYDSKGVYGVEFESTLTRKIYVKTLLTQSFHSWSSYIYPVIVLAFLVWGVIEKSWILAGYSISISVLAILYYSIWYIHECYFSKNSKYFFKKREFTFSQENIIQKVLDIEAYIKWEAFSRWEEVAGCYILHFTNGKLLIIPIWDIPIDTIGEFEMLLREKIDKTITIKKAGGA